MRYLSLFVLALLASSCVTIPNTKTVSVAGTMYAGAIWAETLTSRTGDMSLNELLDFIEPQTERDCIPIGHWDENDKTKWVMDFSVCADDQNQGTVMHLAARAGAIMQSAVDWDRMKTALEKACRELGSRCSNEIQSQIEVMNGR